MEYNKKVLDSSDLSIDTNFIANDEKNFSWHYLFKRERGLQPVLRVWLAGMQPMLRAIFVIKNARFDARHGAHVHFLRTPTIKGFDNF